MRSAALILLLLASPSGAQQPPEPDAKAALARRILDSSLSSWFGPSGDRAERLRAIEQWTGSHPEDAARLAAGFARDDADGGHAFEQSLHHRVQRYYDLNPARHRGLFGALEAAGDASRLLLRGDGTDDEGGLERARNAFEGDGAGAGRRLEAPGAGPGVAASGIYDRLGAGNLTGYSPRVLELQSWLNSLRVPGAPRVPETGRLDHATLVHPAYSLEHDLRRLEADLRRQEVEAARAGRELPRRSSSRKESIDRAARAASLLRSRAQAARDPRRISAELLRALGGLQREGARWVSAAAAEAELQTLEELAELLSPELRSDIGEAPVPEDMRRAYLEQGERLAVRLARAKQAYAQALEILKDPAYPARSQEAARLLALGPSLRRGLSEDTRTYAWIPGRLKTGGSPEPRWRASLRRWAQRLVPRSSWTRSLRARPDASPELLSLFARVAAGDFSRPGR